MIGHAGFRGEGSLTAIETFIVEDEDNKNFK